MNQTPATLLERLRRPDAQGAWAEFVRLYTPLLYYWARRAGRQPHDAADLVQDVFVTLVRELPAFAYDRQRSFRNWLRTILLNKCRERRRREQTVPAAACGAAVEELAAPDLVNDLDETEYRRYLVRHAVRLMQTDFQPITWRACWEFVVAGRPAAEVAAELGVSVDVVYSAKSRVLRRLREEVDGLLD
jgi:RNA polymerase sigma-70 factor (ECF subfamily)